MDKLYIGRITVYNKNSKGMILIHLQLNYTSEMEKAMQKSHGMGYAEYSCKLKKRMQVEMKRQKEYETSCRLRSGLNMHTVYNTLKN
ncbi:hypothetical protein FZW96_18360 [Bacillus sp. BGMRC 2118]|nr:hypothetical protein FZW96_18360 [Bacillus sp. BGMRC 2118]